MERLDIALYGYSKEQREIIDQFFKSNFLNFQKTISLSNKEKEILNDILENPDYEIFIENNIKILIFLGFDEENIKKTLREFPKEIERPIYCGLTEHNVNWPLEYLIEHLLEEKREWGKKK